MSRDYYGKCGTCKYCDLGDVYRSWTSGNQFKCLRSSYRVRADEKPCSRYEPARGRTNDDVAKYDR